MSNEDAYFVTNFSVTILTDCYLKSRRLLSAFDVSSQNHPRKRVIQVKGAKFILIGTNPFRILFSVSNIFTRGGVFMIRIKEKHGKLESALWKLYDDYGLPLIFIFQSSFNSKCSC